MPRPDRSNAIDHVVVIMFENRSFDNLLGLLDEVFEQMFPRLSSP
jgi:phospholipase C